MRLFDADGVLLTAGPRFLDPLAAGAQGSSTWLDDYMTSRSPSPGTYYLEVNNYLSFGACRPASDYQLEASVEEHDVDGFLFASRADRGE